jgi:hypothetical protein
MFGYGTMEWLLIGGVVFFLFVIPIVISAWIWLLARKAEEAKKAEQ